MLQHRRGRRGFPWWEILVGVLVACVVIYALVVTTRRDARCHELGGVTEAGECLDPDGHVLDLG